MKLVSGKAESIVEPGYLFRVIPMAFLLSTLFIFIGCQISPTLSQTTNFDEDMGRLYVHQINNTGKPILPKTKVIIDDEEFSDLDLLNERGLQQRTGNHEIEFKDLKTLSGLSEIDYKLEKNRNLHLYFCENDGSFHWLENNSDREDRKQIEDQGIRLCGKNP